MKSLLVFSLCFFLTFSTCHQVFAHGGGLDSTGCHIESGSGLRHCHDRIGTSDKDEGVSTDTLILGVTGFIGVCILLAWIGHMKASSQKKSEPKMYRYKYGFTSPRIDVSEEGLSLSVRF